LFAKRQQIHDLREEFQRLRFSTSAFSVIRRELCAVIRGVGALDGAQISGGGPRGRCGGRLWFISAAI
jgi:hypothetical protein